MAAVASFAELTRTQPHALPYRVILDEHRARRGDVAYQRLINQWLLNTSLPPVLNLNDALTEVSTHVDAVESHYDTLRKLQLELRTASRGRYKSEAARVAAVRTAHDAVVAAMDDCQKAHEPLKKLLHLFEGSALCFSGGGIRSASFSLGVLQGLARFSCKPVLPGAATSRPLLQNLDYLSTVSGGGYTGSWLMGWAYRSCFADAIKELSAAGKTAGDPEPDPVRHLRNYTSYLAPRYGFTVDTATLGAIVVRNLFLNWLIFLPCLVVLLLCPRLLAILGGGVVILAGHISDLLNHPADQLLMWVAGACIAFAGLVAAYRAWKPPGMFGQPSSRLHSENLFLLLAVVAAWFVVEGWWAGWVNDASLYKSFNLVRIIWLIIDLFVAVSFMMVLRLVRAIKYGGGPFIANGKYRWGRIIWSFVAAAITSTVTALVLEFFAVKVGPVVFGDDDFNPSHRFHVFALPIVLGVLMLGHTLLSGLLSSIEDEEEREWWARSGGVVFIVILAWVGVELACWYPLAHLVHFKNSIATWGIASAVSGGAAAAAGTSAASAAGTKRVDLSQLTKAGKFLARHELLVPALASIALVCIVLLVSSLNDALFNGISTFLTAHWPSYCSGEWLNAENLSAFVMVIAVLIIAFFANACVNVNAFSLHSMYKLRLVRAFLGGSNFGRNADRFTNFDKSDNIEQANLKSLEGAPIHVVNTTLNLVNTRKKSWQQRKAESFTFTPFKSGSWRLGYAPTESFGGPCGITLGTTMAISGAAFNPNMGYNSSPLVTLLMTLFNARLGWWLPNPGWALQRNLTNDKSHDYLSKTGPTFALASIVSEALGKTDDRRKWIQLSDGGHFENLGIYEMVLRRCRSIVVVDAGADRTFNFEDLGNAIRKIQIDLGIPITFPGIDAWPFHEKTLPDNRYCVVGMIDYRCADGDSAPFGYLIYIKPCLNGQEPRDVTAYAAVHDAFPHETTVNQFFNEAQFESYRHLGSDAIEVILTPPPGSKPLPGNDINTFVNTAIAYSGQLQIPGP